MTHLLISLTVSLSLAMTVVAQTRTAPATPEKIPNDWKLFQASTNFSFWGPPDLKEENVRGIDSYVGQFVSPKMTLTFDYGMYSNPLNDPKYKREATTVDGKDAFLVRWDGGVGLYVPRVTADGTIRLQMSIACDKETAEQGLLLLKSIKFAVPPRAR